MDLQLKRWVAIFLGGLIIILILVKALGLFRLPMVKVDAFEAVPANTAIVFEINDFQKTQNRLGESAYSDDLKALAVFNKLFNDLALLDSIFLQSQNDRHILRAGRIVAAAQLSRSDQVDLVYLIDDYRQNIELRTFLNSLPGVRVQESTFKNHKVYTLIGPGGNDFAICSYKGLVIASRHTFLVEFAISQLKNFASNITRDPGFRKAEQLAGNSGDIAIYFNFDNLALLASGFIKGEKDSEVNTLAGILDWMSIDLFFQAESVVANGYGIPHKSNLFWQSVVNQSQPAELIITDALPENTAIASCFGIESMKGWLRSIKKGESEWFEDFILPWMGEEFAYVITEPLSEAIEEDQFAVFSIGNERLAEELLSDLINEAEGVEKSNYQNYEIFKLSTENLLAPIFGESLNTIQKPHMVMLDRFVVFGNTERGIKRWIDKYNLGHTLGRNAAFMEFTGQLPMATNFYLYLDPGRMLQLFKTYLKSDDPEALKTSFSAFQKFSPVEFKWSAHNNMMLTSGQVAYSTSGSQPASIAWKVELDQPAIIPPSIVRNDKNGDLEILIQDASSRVYRIGKNGGIRWTREVDGPIISDIYEVDLYKNDKLQTLFNTEDKIWCFDREGGDVKGRGYPKRTRSSLNGVHVADYDDAKDYRLFIAVKNRGIYAYKKNGARLSGWGPRARTGNIPFPVQHFVADGKDYIVSLNDEGELHGFARNSGRRFQPVKFEANFNSTIGVDVNAKPYRIVACDEDGVAYVTNLSGNYFTLNLEPGSRKNVKFTFADVVEDERKDYIALSENVLVVNDHDDRIYTHEFEENQDEVFTVQLKGKPKQAIGTVSKSARKIYLLDEAGNPLPEFPLAGTTSFVVGDMFEDGGDVLVVANGAVVYAYRLGY
ncbi:MAG: DUF3352 domain-containing protein [Bacteroidota bacterium]